MLIVKFLGSFILGLLFAGFLQYMQVLPQPAPRSSPQSAATQSPRESTTETVAAREPSGLDTMNTISWDKIRCLSSKELEEIYQDVQLQEEIKSDLCDDSRDGRLNRFFSFLKNSNLKLRSEKWGDLAKMFNNPIKYFQSKKVKLFLDFSQGQSLAQAMPGQGVWLGKAFFNLDPIAATALLLHETYHHEESDPGHERCQGGDIPQTNGGCDEVFSLTDSNTRGAYSITVGYLMAQALENRTLDQKAKDHLLAEAFLILATRFNKGVEKTTALAESLAFLDLKGQIWIYHPWLKMVRQIPDPDLWMQKNPMAQLDFHYQKQGFFAISRDKKLFEWSYVSPLRKYYPESIAAEEEILDATRLYLSSQEYAYTSVMKNDHRVYIFDYNQQTQRWEFKSLDPNTESLASTPKKIATYDFFTAGVLDDKGALWKISQGGRGGSGRTFMQEDMYRMQNQKYRTISGGLYTDRFLGVTEKGELYQREGSNLKSWSELPEDIEKVNEGFLNYYTRTTALQMWYWPRNQSEFSAKEKVKIMLPFEVFDFSVIRKLISVAGEKPAQASKVCGQKIHFYDPYWPDMAWALDGESLLLGPLSGSEDDCRTFRENVTSAKLIKRSEAESQGMKSNLRPVDLELKFSHKNPQVFRSW